MSFASGVDVKYPYKLMAIPCNMESTRSRFSFLFLGFLIPSLLVVAAAGHLGYSSKSYSSPSL